jgi:hypothetical protein
MSVQLTLTFATAAAAAAALNLLSGNVAPTPSPSQTRYFHDATHRSVYAIQPGQPVPAVTGAVEIDSATFVTLQSQYSASPTPVSAPSSASAAAPAPAAAGVDDMFGGPATPAVTPMTADQFTNALKAACDPAKNPGARAKLTAFLGKKGAATVGALVAGKSDADLGALFVEASAALA